MSISAYSAIESISRMYPTVVFISIVQLSHGRRLTKRPLGHIHTNDEAQDQFTQPSAGPRSSLLILYLQQDPYMCRRTVKIPTRLHGCTGWSGNWRFTYVLRSFSHIQRLYLSFVYLCSNSVYYYYYYYYYYSYMYNI